MFTKELAEFDLLKHEFYKSWERGELVKKDLQEYACQYFNHVKEFPKYLSAIHTNCDDIKIRQVILGNLIDEEQGEENHPELWLRFGKALDVDRVNVENAALLPSTIALANTFVSLVKKSLAEGLGALYAYERQVPEVAKTKIASLKKFYNISKEEELKFFTVHIEADEWHAQECEDLIKSLNEEQQSVAKVAAVTLAKSLWGFLDGMEQVRITQNYRNI